MLLRFGLSRKPVYTHHRKLPSEPEQRTRFLEELLVAKGLVDPATLDQIIDTYENQIGPMNGARVIAKAWTDAAFHSDLLNDATATLKDLGYYGRQGEHVVAVENTPEIHNMIVCTLCSCYPWPLLGIPPTWYKSDAYRKRAVREPRKVLEEFGVQLHAGQKVKVWDSTAEIRYLVVPMMPREASGLSEDALVGWVSRDSMIGTALPKDPDNVDG